MNTTRRILSCLTATSGLLTSITAAYLWIMLGSPLRKSVNAAEKNVMELRNSIEQLSLECKTMPATTQAVRTSMTSCALAVNQINKTTQTVVDQTSATLPTVDEVAILLKNIGNRLRGFSDGTSKAPLGTEFHSLRTSLYEWDTTLQNSSKEITTMSATLSTELPKLKSILDVSMKDTASALAQISKQIESTEASVVPTLPHLLEATAKDLEASISVLRAISPSVSLGCFIFLLVGMSFTTSSLQSLLR